MSTAPAATTLYAPTLTPALQELIDKHSDLLTRAAQALIERTYYTPYPEHFKAYPQEAMPEGEARFKGQLGKPFDRLKQGGEPLQAAEVSPYTQEPLNISYPHLANPTAYVEVAEALRTPWRKVGPHARAAILAEALERIQQDFYEQAYATQHTTGQGFMMAFQASGPHGNDRALEAVALGWQEQTRYPEATSWVKPAGKFDLTLQKHFAVVPRGVALAIGVSTFPVWNTTPGLFASLVTGNPTIVKPHPLAVYPIALVVARIQEVLAEVGLDPNIVQLATDTPQQPITKVLAEDPRVKIIDFTGGNAFGSYIENLPGKLVFTEKAGVNSILFHSVEDLQKAAGNLAMSFCLYSGQMCTCPQNVFIPKDGITVGGEKVPFEAVAQALADAVKGLVENPKAGHAVAGAVSTDAIIQRLEALKAQGHKVWLDSQPIENPEFAKARTASPLMLEVPPTAVDTIGEECFGPVVFLIPTDTFEQGLELAKRFAQEKGAISAGAYTTDPKVMARIADAMAEAAVAVSFNLNTPAVLVNQNAAFSDFHVSGGNPAGTASFTDPAFVARRFAYVEAKVQG